MMTLIYKILLGIFSVLVCIYIILFYYKEMEYEKGYLDACKDFYKGTVKYKLVDNDDGTRVWKKIFEKDNQDR